MPTTDGIVFIIAVILLFIISAGSVLVRARNDDEKDKKDVEELIKKLNEAEDGKTYSFEEVSEEIKKTMIELDDVVSEIRVEKIIDKKYEEMTVPELKEMAKIYNISGYSSMNKSQLIDILKNTHPQ
jgi:hypothetical protein